MRGWAGVRRRHLPRDWRILEHGGCRVIRDRNDAQLHRPWVALRQLTRVGVGEWNQDIGARLAERDDAAVDATARPPQRQLRSAGGRQLWSTAGGDTGS